MALADPAVVTDVAMRPVADGWTIDVTLTHGDTGWDDYADGWRIETLTGDVLGTRVLLHPHEANRPFTRSLSGVDIPEDVSQVMIRASTSVEGWDATAHGPFPLP
jgi:hypothetical protein